MTLTTIKGLVVMAIYQGIVTRPTRDFALVIRNSLETKKAYAENSRKPCFVW